MTSHSKQDRDNAFFSLGMDIVLGAKMLLKSTEKAPRHFAAEQGTVKFTKTLFDRKGKQKIF